MNDFADERGGLRYLIALRQHWRLMALLVVAAVGAALLYSSSADKRYEAEADLLVTPISPTDPTYAGIPVIRESGESRAVLTVARLLQTPTVAEGVKRQLRSDRSRASLADSIDVVPQEQSTIVTVVGKAPTGRAAARLANTFARVLVDQRTATFQRNVQAAADRASRQLEAIPPLQRTSPQGLAAQTRLDSVAPLLNTPDPTVQLASPAAVPLDPVWPKTKLSVLVALLVALMLGTGIAVGLELLNPRYRREDELVRDHRLPVLARIPRLGRRELARYFSGAQPLPADAKEAYRTLRANLSRAGSGGRVPDRILVVSAVPGEGKTMTSVNLAISLADVGLRVLLVDGDLRRPMVGTLLGAGVPRATFADVLHGTVAPEDAVVDAPGQPPNLKLLLSHPGPFFVDKLTPDLVDSVLERLRPVADVVVFDSPPLTEVSDALAYAEVTDTSIIAVRLGHSRRDKLRDLRRLLLQRNVAPAGFVITTRDRPRAKGYYASRGAFAEPFPQLVEPSSMPESIETGSKR
jgi:succinoglycan biosynthesis transport protein ExoP